MVEKGKRKGLGRGLDALFGDTQDEPREPPVNLNSSTPPGNGTETVSIERLRPGRYQPRRNFDPGEMDELSESLKVHGIIQPILVRQSDEGASEFEIIAGERRWRAAQLAQLHEVPILVRELTDSEALEIALVENLQRENLSPLEEAEGYRRLMDEFLHTQEALAELLGKSRSHVANMMRLLNLPDEIKSMVDCGELSAGHARALLGADNPVLLAQEVLKSGLNVRQTEKLVKNGKTETRLPPPRRAKDGNTIALENDLTALLGLQVSIDFSDPGGRVVIVYDSLEQLDDILLRLKGGRSIN